MQIAFSDFSAFLVAYCLLQVQNIFNHPAIAVEQTEDGRDAAIAVVHNRPGKEYPTDLKHQQTLYRSLSC